MKISRDPLRATRTSSQGNARRPKTSISVPKASSEKAAVPRPVSNWPSASRPPAMAGSMTRAKTTTRSCITSQPSAMRPASLPSRPRSSSVLVATTVEEIASARPKAIAVPSGRPSNPLPTALPSAVASAICATAPGTAIRQTATRSVGRKCSPTPNSSSATPTSAMALTTARSATNPGV